MHERKKTATGQLVERRKDMATADFIQIGLMYMKIFGRSKGTNFFKKSQIKPRTYTRVVAGLHRGTGPRQAHDPTQAFIK